MLLDSNIIIYASQPRFVEVREFIAQHSPGVSAVSLVEVLGYHKLSELERRLYERFFAAATVFPVSDAVISHAVKLRQLRKMTLGDSLVAATAQIEGRTLVTHNTRDFDWIPGLKLLDVIKAP